ncbi:hypothetical protein [Halobaculum sp. D14]|uniref:hypothetical protein n=1 Tax=Halobaculum sp. D14 TaxID=3421642 RepID=UPI003EBEBB63
MLRRDRRGRLTLPDVVFTLFSVACLGALTPVFYTLLKQNAGEFSAGEQLLFQAMVPALLVVMLAMIYITAVGGGGTRS